MYMLSSCPFATAAAAAIISIVEYRVARNSPRPPNWSLVTRVPGNVWIMPHHRTAAVAPALLSRTAKTFYPLIELPRGRNSRATLVIYIGRYICRLMRGRVHVIMRRRCGNVLARGALIFGAGLSMHAGGFSNGSLLAAWVMCVIHNGVGTGRLECWLQLDMCGGIDGMLGEFYLVFSAIVLVSAFVRSLA